MTICLKQGDDDSGNSSIITVGKKIEQIAIQYYDMSSDAKLSDLIKKVRADEQHHSEVNHRYADGK